MDKVKKIYIDLDGVMADFDRGLRDLCGIEPVDQMKSTEADDDRTFTAIRECEHFYQRLEEVPGAKQLFDQLYEKYGDKVEILSGIPNPKRNIQEAGEDKLSWVREHLSDQVKVNLVRRAEKKNFCTGPNCVLIDDYEKNIREWEKQGGTGILYRSAEQMLQDLEKMFSEGEEEESSEGIFAMCEEPAREYSVEKARALAEKASTEQEIADVYAVAWNKFLWFADEIDDYKVGSDKFKKACEITDAWTDVRHIVEEKILPILGSEGGVIPEAATVDALAPFMERNGYVYESGWLMPIEGWKVDLPLLQVRKHRNNERSVQR